MTSSTLLHVAAALVFVSTAEAAISITSLGTAAPPSSFVPPGSAESFPLISAIDDTSPLFADVSSAPLAPGKNVLFSSPASHREIGLGWATWSHGYDGDVYYVGAGFDFAMTLTFDQPDLQAFYFYVMPETFGATGMFITASGDDGASQSISELIFHDPGAKGFLVATDGLSKLTSITVSSAKSGFGVGFAFGEFGWSKTVPAPAALALLGLAGLRSRRRRD